MSDLPGYEIGECIHGSARAVVHRGIRLEDRLPVLIKRAAGPDDAGGRARLEHEHGVLKSLRLASIVGVHGLAHSGHGVALIAAHVAGRSLVDVIAERRLALPDVLRLAHQLATALEGLHQAGWIHAGLAPACIVYDQGSAAGTIIGIDHATPLHRAAEAGPDAGTDLAQAALAYVSPEQTGRMNRSVDHRSDLYSLGVTTYELLVGRCPFDGRDALEMVHAHLAVTPKAPGDVDASVPRVVSDIVMKLLAKSPDDRYQSAAGLAQDLGVCLGQLRDDGGIAPLELGRSDLPPRLAFPDRLYGREAETARLLQALARVAAGHVEELLITGPAGAGKTSLLDSAGPAMTRAGGRVIAGRFHQAGYEQPFGAIVGALDALVRQVLTEDEAQLATWRERILAATLGNARVIVDVLPSLELIIGPQPGLVSLGAFDAQNRFNLTFLNFVQVFCRPERPLVLCLDDAQAADAASLHLLTLLATAKTSSGFLLVLAYRDGETAEDHPLRRTLDDHRRRGTRVESIALGALSADGTARLIADTMRTDAAGAAALADVVWRKTAGNPLFVREYLQAIHQQRLVRHDSDGTIRVDLDRVHAIQMTESVADLLIERIGSLPADAQAMLPVAAAMGHRFDLGTLAAVVGSPVDRIEHVLAAAVRDDFVAQDAGQYAFLHERVRRAAYSLVPDADRPALHLRIGRALLARATPPEHDAQLFEIVTQMNLGSALVADPHERRQIVALNRTAADRARSATAYQVAARLQRTIIELLGPAACTEAYEDACDAHMKLAENLSLAADFDGALQAIATMEPHVRPGIDSVRLQTLKVSVFTTMGNMRDAMACGVAAARAHGVDLPEDPEVLRARLAAEIAAILKTIAERDIESLLDLPESRDPEHNALMALLMHCIPAVFQTNAILFSLMCCQMVTLSLKHGNCRVSAKGYGSLAVILSGVLGRYADSARFGKLGVDLTHRFDDPSSRSAAFFVWGMFASAWTAPVGHSLELLEESRVWGLTTGDHAHAAYGSARRTTHEFFMGTPIPAVRRSTEASRQFLDQINDRINLDLITPRLRFLKWLAGELPGGATLDGDGFDEQAFHAHLLASGNQSMISHFAILRLMQRYLGGEFRAALAFGRESAAALAGSTGMIIIAEHNLYLSLTMCALFDAAADDERREFEATLDRHQEEVRTWTDGCPVNFEQQYLLVEAERARLGGDALAAMTLYDRAIAAARRHGFTHIEALASELASRFWAGLGKAEFAHLYAARALTEYGAWGASVKCRQLLAETGQAPAGPVSAEPGTGGAVDLAALLKATQALSGELVLERLLRTLMNTILEAAGADAGSLVLPSGDGFVVRAHKSAGAADATVMTAIPLAEAAQLSVSIVTYVTRTREPVVLDDATRGQFQSDVYVQQRRARSVLCVPILHQGRLSGVVYLENTLVTGAFTSDRLAALNILVSQTAVSIQNAELFAAQRQANAALQDEIEVRQRAEQELTRYRDHLEDLVTARTSELESAQGRLIEMSRRAGMAEVASGVLHNVGNVLNSVNVGASVARDEVKALRVGAVSRLSSLLDEHAADLPAFLTQDAKGRQVPEYLRTLGANLVEEQARILASFDTMGRHLEHMKSVIAAQQGYSRTAALTDICALQDLFDAALDITGGTFAQQGIQVVRRFEPVPAVPVERHEVLQILVNLISNARHALEAKAAGPRVITLGLAWCGDHHVRMTVGDNGVGISPANMSKMFTHGFTTKKTGHGFGLHNCANVAQRMKGNLTVTSDGDDSGATFTLQIPISLTEAPALAGASPRG